MACTSCFRSSDRSTDKTPQIFVVNEITGVITQLSDGPGVDAGSINVARKTNKVYYLRRPGNDAPGTLIEVDLDALFRAITNGEADARRFERTRRHVAEEFHRRRRIHLDADEKTAYLGFDQRRAPARQPGQPVPQVPGWPAGNGPAPTARRARCSKCRSAWATCRPIRSSRARSCIATKPAAMPRNACGSSTPMARTIALCSRT